MKKNIFEEIKNSTEKGVNKVVYKWKGLKKPHKIAVASLAGLLLIGGGVLVQLLL